MKTIKNQIGKMAVVIMVIFSMISCTKEEIKILIQHHNLVLITSAKMIQAALPTL